MKKRRAEAKSRRKNRQKTQEANTRVAKETQKIIPLWVRRFNAWLSAFFTNNTLCQSNIYNNRLLINHSIEKTTNESRE